MSNNQELDLSRAVVPNTTALQAAIIAETAGLPQHHEPQTRAIKRPKRWLSYFQVTLPLAACGLLVVMMVTGPNNIVEPDVQLAATDDLDWQEIMLSEDEWLLADL